MKTQNRSITHRNRHPTVGHSLHVVREEMQNPHPPRHLHPRLDLHRGPHPKPVRAVRENNRAHILRRRPRRVQRKGLDGEGGGHVLGPAGPDLPGRDEHEAHLAAGVQQLERAVVVGEGGPVGVLDGDVLGEGEVDGGAVGDGEGGELDGVDGDLGLGGLEDGEEHDEDHNDDEDEEDRGDDARREVGAARWGLLVPWFAHG